MKCIVLLASPGAGKGVASDYIENKYGYKHISSGSLLRSEALVNEEIKSLIDKGKSDSNKTRIISHLLNVGFISCDNNTSSIFINKLFEYFLL